MLSTVRNVAKKAQLLGWDALGLAQQAASGVIAFVAAVAGNWQPVPTTVAAALNQLAAPNKVSSQTSSGTGTPTVQATTPTISKQKTGNVRVTGFVSVVTAGADTVHIQLIGSVSGTIATANIGVGAALAVLGSLTALDTIAAAPGGQTYTIQANATGNLTQVAGAINVDAVEF